MMETAIHFFYRINVSRISLQLSDHDETVNNTKSISIRFFVHLQTNLAKQVRECQDAIKVEIMKYSYLSLCQEAKL